MFHSLHAEKAGVNNPKAFPTSQQLIISLYRDRFSSFLLHGNMLQPNAKASAFFTFSGLILYLFIIRDRGHLTM